jgi:protein-S-isoprenylcysteine O-methyltransferase Ste14
MAAFQLLDGLENMIETIFQPTLFILISVLFGFLARDWLRQRSSHGLTRFLALQCILALTVLSLPAWPRDPLAPMHILSWSLILAALLMAGYGYRLLRLEGKPELKLAADQQLPVEGFYKYVRHPLYSSLILFVDGGVHQSHHHVQHGPAVRSDLIHLPNSQGRRDGKPRSIWNRVRPLSGRQ